MVNHEGIYIYTSFIFPRYSSLIEEKDYSLYETLDAKDFYVYRDFILNQFKDNSHKEDADEVYGLYEISHILFLYFILKHYGEITILTPYGSFFRYVRNMINNDKKVWEFSDGDVPGTTKIVYKS